MSFDIFIYLCNYYYYQEKEHNHSLQKFPHALLFSPFHPFRKPLNCFLSLQMSRLFLDFYIAVNGSNPFLLIAEYYSIVGMCHILLMHTLAEGHLDDFQFGAVRSQAAMNIHTQVFAQTYAFLSHGWIPRSGMAGSYLSVLNLLRHCQTAGCWLCFKPRYKSVHRRAALYM